MNGLMSRGETPCTSTRRPCFRRTTASIFAFLQASPEIGNESSVFAFFRKFDQGALQIKGSNPGPASD